MVAGSEIKINAEGIFITTPKTFRVRANSHNFEQGERVDFKIPILPKFGEHYLHFVGVDSNDAPLANHSYIIFDEYGEIISQGVLDDEGRTELLYYNSSKKYEMHIMHNDDFLERDRENQ